MTWLRNSAASEEVNRRSVARSSVSWPRARRRARDRGGSITGGDDQVHHFTRRWHVPEEKAECVVDGLSLNEVIVVEDEDNSFGNGGDLVDCGCQDPFGRRRLRGLQGAQGSFSDAGLNGLQSSDK